MKISFTTQQLIYPCIECGASPSVRHCLPEGPWYTRFEVWCDNCKDEQPVTACCENLADAFVQWNAENRVSR